MKPREFIVGFLAFVLFDSILITFYTLFIFNPGISSTLNYHLQEEVRVNNAFISSYRDFSKALFDEAINKDNILKLVYQYDHAPPENKNVYRARLYDSLAYVYKIIKHNNFNIFHFHDAQGNSLLRFHKPKKFGDNLLFFRKSIGTIIKKHQYIEGFEEGRIINSYRFIYPLFYNEEYIGSVETSVSIISLLHEKEQAFLGSAKLYVKEEIYDRIVNKNTKKYYTNCNINGYKTYLFSSTDKEKERKIPDSTIWLLNEKAQESINNISTTNRAVVKWVRTNNNWLITFFPLKNIAGQQVALVGAYEIYKPLDALLKSKRIVTIVSTVVSLLLMLFFLFMTWGKRQAIQRQKIIQKAKEKAEEMARLKSSFLANMSHEIRTPMNGVVGMTEILKLTPLDKNQKEFVSIIESSASSLLNVINDILDFSKIDSNKIEIEFITFHIRKSIEDVGDSLLLPVEKKGIAMLTYIDPNIPDTLIGDPARLRQIILNLANNAIKFTDEGEVLISAELVKTDDKGVTILFKVKDTGIGISAEAQQKLFSAFTQADATINRKYGGTGLGLTISKSLVELMGGELLLESEVGKGSVFYFSLSFEVGEDSSETYFSDTEDLSSLRVLILDDNNSNRIIFRKYFSFWNIHSDEAENVEEAIEKVKTAIANQAAYNIIIVDFQMPGKSGFDFADILRKENLKRNTKLILFSSISDMIDTKTIQQYGFESYLYKPIKYHPFRKIIFDTINKQVDKKIEKVTDDASDNNMPGNYDLKILLAEDNLINQKVAVVTLNKLGYPNVDVANNGTEAVQMHLNNSYDVILMDIQMPIMSGLEATERIRENERDNPKAKKVTIIALTANALEKDVKKYLEQGIDSVLTKPFKHADLRKVLF